MKRLISILTLTILALSGYTKVASDKAMDEAKATLAKMTLDEKLSLCAGISTMSLNPIPRVGINREFYFSDSSCNVRADLDRMTFGKANKADDPCDQSTSLPALEVLAATWNPSLASEYGHVIGSELRARKKDMILGPGVNIMRTPLCGRNWEYLSEDPALAASIVVAYIKAVQSHDCSTCVKHFAANSQELNRNTVICTMDERALHEIYLPVFRAAIKEAGSLAVMNAYNKLEIPAVCKAEFCSENAMLNIDILRKAWGFKGIVITDWGSVHDTVKGVKGGTGIEMNAGKQIRVFKPEPLKKALKAGDITEADIDNMVLHTLYVMTRIGFIGERKRDSGCINTKAHQAVARKVAEEGTILLKNDKGVLPLNPNVVKNVVVMGKGAVTKHCNGGGSAEGKPPYEVVPLEGINNRLGDKVNVTYMPLPLDDQNAKLSTLPESSINTFNSKAKDKGMTVRTSKASCFANKTLSEMEETVKKADAVIVLTGTEHGHGRALEGEGADRPNMLLPPGHDEAIAKVLTWFPDAVIVNHAGSPMAMPWIDDAATLIEIGYAGMEGGNALAAILFGDVNPSGKLPHTCPYKLSDTPTAQPETYNGTNSFYKEGIFVGYRWYDKKKIKPMFPFGYGLSYTTFKYSDITASSKKLSPDGELSVSVKVTNTGDRKGKEIVQLYIRDLAWFPKVKREVRSLKNYAKVELKPGESKVVILTVKPRDLSYFDVEAKNFRADAGRYAAEIGASSRDIRGKVKFRLTGDFTGAM